MHQITLIECKNMFSPTKQYLKDFDNQHDFERMCAVILVAQNYKDVVLIAPKGGGDYGKDITFTTSNGEKGLACVTLRKDSNTKFKQDFEKRDKNEYIKYIFFTNQPLTAKQKEKFIEYCKNKLNSDLIPQDLEAIRSYLDAPQGYGIKQKFLQLELSNEEVTSMQKLWHDNLMNLEKNGDISAEHYFNTQSKLTSLIASQYNKDSQFINNNKFLKNIYQNELPLTSHLTIPLILFIHRIILVKNPSYNWTGNLRKVQTWIGSNNTSIADAIFIPPTSEQVPKLLKELLKKWNTQYISTTKLGKEKIIEAISDFHIDFLSIHPFLDANGRVATILLNQQILDLLKTNIWITLKKDLVYLKALQKGQRGDRANFYALLKKELIKL